MLGQGGAACEGDLVGTEPKTLHEAKLNETVQASPAVAD
jgi:hypothetical protein